MEINKTKNIEEKYKEYFSNLFNFGDTNTTAVENIYCTYSKGLLEGPYIKKYITEEPDETNETLEIKYSYLRGLLHGKR